MRPVPANRYISMLYRYSQRYFAQRMCDCPLDVGQLPFLLDLYRNPGSTQDQLSCSLGMDKGTTARSLAQLECLGLVSREPDANDRRMNHVQPTPRAMAMREELFVVVDDLHRILFDGITAQEQEQVIALLIRMKDNIEGYLESQKQ